MDIKISPVFILIFLLFGWKCFAQTVVWSENFSTHSNGTKNDPGGKWTSTCTGCTSNATAFFEVQNNAFEGQDLDAQGIWLSEWIDVSAYPNVDLSVVVTGDADNDAGEYCIVEYSADNGAFTAFIHGNNNPLGAVNRTPVAQISGADSVRIRIRMIVSATSEQYVFDDIFVVSPDTEPGSGFALDFDDAGSATTGDVIELGNFPNIIAGDFTITAWINCDNVATTGQRIFCDDQGNTADGFALSLGDPGSGRLRFYIRSANAVSLDMSNATYYLNSNIWYHVAAVHNAATNARIIYVNGVNAASDTYTNNPGASPDALASIGGETSSSTESTNRFDGEIDEVTIWSSVLSQTQIRDLMCEKVNPSAANLLAYYKFDDGAGYMARDETGNYHGSLTNMDQSNDWTNSGASIGDASTYNYTGSWAGVSVFLQSSQSDSLRVNNITGTPSGLHVYNVNSAPNSSTGAGGIGGNDTYFGVFNAFGTSPTYSATYYYGENDAYQLGTLDESAMVLYKRDNNSDLTWSLTAATLNPTSKTLTLAGESTEYIVGNSFTPLPITLLSFNAFPTGKEVSIEWETASEINNEFFIVERSTDLNSFEIINKISGAGNSSKKIQYFTTDKFPIIGYSYYRLKQIDFDGNFTYSSIRSVYIGNEKELIIYPNPTQNVIKISSPIHELIVHNIYLTDLSGNKLEINIEQLNSHNVNIDVTSLSSGVYFIGGLTSDERKFRIVIGN